jgi:hypothetical protein
MNTMEPRAYALTTVDRVRNVRLRIEADGFDTLFANLINAVSDFIEGECNRRFMATDYEELHTIHTYGQQMLVLRNAPVVELTAFEYRSGAKTNPTWNAFDPDSWELDEEAGIIETSGMLEKFLKISYNAGYLIDWEHYDDDELHTLPSDITDLAERMVVKWYKRREAEGKMSEGFDGAQIAWRDDLTKDDQATIDRYRRIPVLS